MENDKEKTNKKVSKVAVRTQSAANGIEKKLETIVYNQEGEKSGTFALPPSVFGAKWNADMVHQVVFSMRSNARSGTADSKGRSEVRGGGKKPWQQKGTGRARHGSRRSPIWRGGGVTHGPLSERNYDKKINKKTNARAFVALMSEKFRSGKIIFVDAIVLKAAKTKEANGVLLALSKVKGFENLTHKKESNVYLALPKREIKLEKSFRNILQMEIGEVKNLSALDLATHRYIVMVGPKESIPLIEKRLGKK
ncbi:MAG: 50S ribosomal protein L4 [Patescibacteria group bacterium]